ncbi:MAG: hypothetical protein GSR77_02925 [Desulfurococcales archaeon]|nr:hypothetical protein [Desulfurococcales archaeon]
MVTTQNKCKSIVVKFGGSVITDKTKSYTIKHDVLDRLAKITKEYLEEGGKIAIVHGGGSFGHHEVKRIEEEKGVLESSDAPQIQYSMLLLALEVSKTLLKHGIPAVLHPPHTLCDKPTVKDCRMSPIIRDYAQSLVPVTYGDAIPYDDKIYIISGDDLAAALVSILSTDCLVYVIDEPGVMTSEGKILETLTSLKDLELREDNKIDVTGGLRKKLETALELSHHYRGTIIITNPDGFEKILKGQDIKSVGTVIRATRSED